MSSAKASAKKRKRETAADPTARFEVSTSATGKVGPLLVSYPAIQPPPSTAFKCYARKRFKTSEAGSDQQDLLVVGETPSIELVSNYEITKNVAEAGCRYIIAVRNTRTGTISMLPTAKIPHIMNHTVKALKSIPSAPAPSKLQYLEAKTTLGETFGTKKQKANIRAQERNRIDVSAMEGVMDYVMDSIDKGAEGLMTEEQAKVATDKNRLIPPFSLTATDPAEVYPLHSIIPESEWKALVISPFDAAETDREKIALLPFRKSNWVNNHLLSVGESTGKSKKKNLKIILYISAMLAFRQACFGKTIEKEKLYERLSAVPSIVADGLLSRFTETARGSTSYQSTSATKTSILTHIFALCLKLDEYATNTTVIAHDLSMSVTEINQIFKSLGCKIVKLSERERSRLGQSDASADEKRAVLSAPVEFPKPRLRKK
ncbi:hypothetical protein HYPSUDRAFT_146886 [Hypholoma sublateritium FD-334 SS-4]|uniref:Rpa49 subunit specific to nuclear RNA polymerase I n=1 Tax=Hypholoma sublateritium (strain FD-334 SS-4) TaxID=945553 RepID=A0A0D2NKW5_HYPSF|nr:hypothetical protein HYPSUDRAFT_146886 [Hypholoma sublateritium FD-334 SS-4]